MAKVKEEKDKKKDDKPAAGGDAGDKKGKGKEKEKDDKKDSKKDKDKEKDKGGKDKGGKDKATGTDIKDDGKKGKEADAAKKRQEPEPEVPKTASETARDEAEYRAMQRRNRFKRFWPSITKVKIKTVPWHPPGKPEKPPKVVIDMPEITIRKWIPPYMRAKRQPRTRTMRVPLEEMHKPSEVSKLRRIWHGFDQVERNKMVLHGHTACDTRKYSCTYCGSQTACIALVARALLDQKTPQQLVRRDVDDVIDAGDKFYKRCVAAMKCYKGKPALKLNQLMPYFFFRDVKYTVKLTEADSGVLARHPDNTKAGPDLMALMEKRTGQEFYMVLTVGGDRHFLIFGHPPESGTGSSVKTIIYIFDPHSLNEIGLPFNKFIFGHPPKSGTAGPSEKTIIYIFDPHSLNEIGLPFNKVMQDGMLCCGNITNLPVGGAILRFAGVNSFVMDFLATYGDLNAANREKPKPPVTLTNIEIVQKEPVDRQPNPLYQVDFNALPKNNQLEWQALQMNVLLDKKIHEGKHAFGSLSAASIATSQRRNRQRMNEFYLKIPPPEPAPTLPVPPEKAPAELTKDQIMQMRGEDFFLACPAADGHAYGRDDLIPLPIEPNVKSPVEQQEANCVSQFKTLGEGKAIVRGTRHHAVMRYEKFKYYTGVACCVAALATCQRLRSRAWCEDTVDETLDCGFNFFRESMEPRRGPIRRLVLGEMSDIIRIRDTEYRHRDRGIVVWGKMNSRITKVFDVCRGIETFFKEADTGILQIPGELETAIWNEGGKYYLYHPWPADKFGFRVSLQSGGKAFLMSFDTIRRLCEHFIEATKELKRKPFSISEVNVFELEPRPEPVNSMKPVGPNRWMVRGSFHEADDRFPEENRGRQATAAAVAAIAYAGVADPSTWTAEDVDETLLRGDSLYSSTMENLEKLGINFETPVLNEEEGEGEDEGGAPGAGPSGTLAAADVLPRFRITDYDCIETDVMDSAFTGVLGNTVTPGVLPLKESLNHMFRDNKSAVLTARGSSLAVWKFDNHYYMFDPHGVDEDGLPTEENTGAAALLRTKTVEELTETILSNLPPGTDDSFNLSPVDVYPVKLNPEIGAPELYPNGRLQNKAFEWMNRGTAAMLMGPRAENSAIGKATVKARIPEDDRAGRTLALPAAAAFCAASEAVPPPDMHQDHMYNFLDTGAEYYRQHVRRTGRKDMTVEDLKEKFELGANTLSLEIGEPTRLPLRLPDKTGEGDDEDEVAMMEGEEIGEQPPKEQKELLFKTWHDNSQPETAWLLLGDYHQLGVWMQAGGKLVVFDAAPTLPGGLLTNHRIQKGDQLRLQRIKDEAPQEGEGDDEDDDAGGEGEEQPEPEPEPVPIASCPVMMVFATPGEFIDKMVAKNQLDNKQMIGPYWLYPVKVTNELTNALRERRTPAAGGEEAGDGEEEEDALVEPLSDEAIGPHYERVSRAVASLRGRMAQNEHYFMDHPNRDRQDAATAIMGVVIQHIEPYQTWKPPLLDAAIKYGDRLYTLSLPNATKPPRLKPEEVAKEFHVTMFDIKLEVEPEVVTGDYKAGETGHPLSLKRVIKKFFETYTYGVLCTKGFCVALWKAADNKATCYYDPHPTGPQGLTSPGAGAGLVIFSDMDELADNFRRNLDVLARPGSNRITIASVKVNWELSKPPPVESPPGAVPDEGYEHKVLTAYVETRRGCTLMRGSRPLDLPKFTRDALIQSSASAVVAVCMAHLRRPSLWTRRTLDGIINDGGAVFATSLSQLGYEFRPGDDILLPLQVATRFRLGVNQVRLDLQQVFTGKLEVRTPPGIPVRAALEHFFTTFTHGVLWCSPHAVAVFRCAGTPGYYMVDPHACGPKGLREEELEDGAPCVQGFISPKLMAFAYLQNYPVADRYRKEFVLYSVAVKVSPILKLTSDPPLLNDKTGKLVPATSKVDFHGAKRRASEGDRRHPPGSTTCLDAQRATNARDDKNKMGRGMRNTSGWLVLTDATQYLSAGHSMACRRFPHGSRNNQAVACCIMAVAMSRVEDVCRWCVETLNQILDSGDQLYQDSYLHYRPRGTKLLKINQILRKFYTPGNCQCRVTIYRARQGGIVDDDLYTQVMQFFREEKAGVFVAGDGDFAVALFRTPRGFYMFDPADRDRYGRAVAPVCVGKARACFSQYCTVKALTDKLGANIPPVIVKAQEDVPADPNTESKGSMTAMRRDSAVRFEEPETFEIFGMDVTSLRKMGRRGGRHRAEPPAPPRPPPPERERTSQTPVSAVSVVATT